MKKVVLIASIVVMALIAGCKAATQSTPALALTGLVTTQQSWTLDQLKAMDVVSETVTKKDATIDVSGVLLTDLLALAGPTAAAATVTFTGSDGYSADVDLAFLTSCATCMVQIGDDGKLNTILPDQSTKAWVSDLVSIEVK
jgi:hypothetical protein